MTGYRSDHVIEVDRLPDSTNAFRFDGHERGTSVSFFINYNPPDTGTELHRYPYEETFIVEDGNDRFTVGESTIEATAGEIVVVPAETPHRLVNARSTALRKISLHPIVRMKTEWLN